MGRIRILIIILTACVVSNSPPQAVADPPLKALIVDGQNNHGIWPKTSKMMKAYLEQTGLFSVEMARTKPQGIDSEFRPEFSRYHVVVSNYNGAPWPETTRGALVQYVRNGGGLVVVHAANNAFPDWPEYNEMIGLGGWGGRDEKSGPYVYVDSQGKLVRDSQPGPGGHHGAEHPFLIVVRDAHHPITQGMPPAWMHAKDELYDFLRGPAENLHVLATAFADPQYGGSGRHEPMLMTIQYGKGRVFHTPMGHGDYSQECAGFIVCFQRGAEWAATGKVTQPIPHDFPTADQVVQRKFEE